MADAAAKTGPAGLDEALRWLREHFVPESARGLRIAYQFELSGPDGGSFSARVDDGHLAVEPGVLAEPDVTFRLAALDFFAVLAGQANADMLVMQDRLEVKGDLSLALRLRRVFQ